jgi:hypothetical protein
MTSLGSFCSCQNTNSDYFGHICFFLVVIRDRQDSNPTMEQDKPDINFKIERNSVGVVKCCGWDFDDATLSANQVQLFMDLTHHLFIRHPVRSITVLLA